MSLPDCWRVVCARTAARALGLADAVRTAGGMDADATKTAGPAATGAHGVWPGSARDRAQARTKRNICMLR